MKVKNQIFKKIKNIGKGKTVEIDIYPLATELYEELEKKNMISNLKKNSSTREYKNTKRFNLFKI
ncbi:hypothetical protein EXQ37_13180 [Clostridium botulinum]|nr:hypothetical protein [Clostridium botulinum]MBO0540985.1 hypothetical protein [Clostridium botulinum]MBO0560653.1 hypothetical protein [Clostridium botulinum]MBO0562681.1 hypothetical protein [Clostridium botulinum]